MSAWDVDGTAASPRPRGWTRGDDRPDDRAPGFPAPAGMDLVREAGRAADARLPRARGDGPGVVLRRQHDRRASPRPRGWTAWAEPAAGAALGFPAPAGMDPKRARRSRSCIRLPRARGDGPARVPPDIFVGAASPRPRGWTREHVVGRLDHAGFPAPAGMDPGEAWPTTTGDGLPRARGDGPVPLQAGVRVFAASPRPRGWTLGLHQLLRRQPGFPAPAGMDRLSDPDRSVKRWLPRARGDGPSNLYRLP